MRGKRWVDDEHSLKALTDNVPNTMAACFGMIEEHYFAGPWVMGDRFSVCDTYLLAISEWFESDGVDINHYPKLKAHRAAMYKRDSVVKARKALNI